MVRNWAMVSHDVFISKCCIARTSRSLQAALRRAVGILMVSSVQMQSPRSLSQVSVAAARAIDIMERVIEEVCSW